jgi:hypothetical protein
VWRTRPDGTVAEPGNKRWLKRGFARDLKVDPETIRLWLNDKNQPDKEKTLPRIEKVLFGGNPDFAIWSRWLADSLERTRKANTPTKLNREDIAALILSYLAIPILYGFSAAAKWFEWETGSHNFGDDFGVAVLLILPLSLLALRWRKLSPIEMSAYCISLLIPIIGSGVILTNLLDVRFYRPLFAAVGFFGAVGFVVWRRRHVSSQEVALFYYYFMLQTLLFTGLLNSVLNWYFCCYEYQPRLAAGWGVLGLIATVSLAYFRWGRAGPLEVGLYVIGVVYGGLVAPLAMGWIPPGIAAMLATAAPLAVALVYSRFPIKAGRPAQLR